MPRPSTLLAAVLLPVLGAWICLFFVLPAMTARHHAERRAQGRALARRLELTDLALFTEARYTRHPSQADRFAAFQDHPMALDHFPSGSMLFPPPPGPFREGIP